MSALSGARGQCAAAAPEVHAGVAAMIASLAHRGSGTQSLWADPSCPVTLAHRAGTPSDDPQPRRSPCGRFLLSLDGRLYNRSGLLGQCDGWLGDHAADDATLLLASITQRGLRRTLRLCDGAFALSLWDSEKQTLWLARDRTGERPLYYGWNRGVFLFASELKAMHCYPGFSAAIKRSALALLLRYGYIPAPHTIHEGIYKLPPGCMLALDSPAHIAGLAGIPPHARVHPYWDAAEAMRAAVATRPEFTDMQDRSGDRLDALLHAAVARRNRGPGKVGTFLSGGTDSSLITALLQAQSALPIDSFTVGFDDPGHDESAWAGQVSRHLRTRHTQHVLRGRDVPGLVSAMAAVWCEPFADASQVPTLLASRLAAAQTKVVLTGDGGDELFFGHASYQRAVRNAAWVARAPCWLRRTMTRGPGASREHARLGGWPALRDELDACTVEQHYQLRVSRWRDPTAVVLGACEASTLFTDQDRWLRAGTPADRVQYLDFRMDLGNGILTKIDRAGMACGVETRSPLLDLEVIEFAWGLPMQWKFHNGEHKHILKTQLLRHLPATLVNRPKQGFGPPMASWLAGPLRDWAETLLDETRLRGEGYFDTAIVRGMWLAFCQGQRKWHTHLWPILMFQAWLEHHGRSVARA